MATEQAKVGDILHTSWGYDMTINNYCKVLENTGKTVKCIMIGTKGNFDGHNGEVEPDASREFGQPFRLRIRKGNDNEKCYYSGSYPYCAGSGNFTAKRQDSFELWNGKPNYENHDD